MTIEEFVKKLEDRVFYGEKVPLICLVCKHNELNWQIVSGLRQESTDNNNGDMKQLMGTCKRCTHIMLFDANEIEKL